MIYYYSDGDYKYSNYYTLNTFDLNTLSKKYIYDNKNISAADAVSGKKAKGDLIWTNHSN